MADPIRFFLWDDGTFPNSHLPVLVFENAVKLPSFFKGRFLKQLFSKNGWGNNWRDGIYTYHHYHSITHEVVGVIKGTTALLLGGEQGIIVPVEKGDILVIPAGVAHVNLGDKYDVISIGGYPGGSDYDIKLGKPTDRPATDKQIARVPLPSTDPITGTTEGVPEIWEEIDKAHHAAHHQKVEQSKRQPTNTSTTH